MNHLDFDRHLIRQHNEEMLERCGRCGSQGDCGPIVSRAVRGSSPLPGGERCRCCAGQGLRDSTSP